MGGCPSEEIGAYLDAELPAERVAALEAHFNACLICREELNSQKVFLLELSRSLEQKAPIELPKEFTRAIVTKAESSVTGLRKSSERATAAAIVLLLLVLSAVGFAGDWGRVTAEAARPFGMFGALLDAAAGLFQSVVFAAGFVLKKVFPAAGVPLFALVLVAAGAVIFLLFRRTRRAAGDIG